MELRILRLKSGCGPNVYMLVEMGNHGYNAYKNTWGCSSDELKAILKKEYDAILKAIDKPVVDGTADFKELTPEELEIANKADLHHHDWIAKGYQYDPDEN